MTRAWELLLSKPTTIGMAKQTMQGNKLYYLFQSLRAQNDQQPLASSLISQSANQRTEVWVR